MTSNTSRIAAGFGIAAVAVAAAGALFVWSGAYDVAADDPHTRPVAALLETLRERSIATRAAKLTVPDLSDPARAVQGAGNYAAMCAGCHLTPGAGASELSRGLYPQPPDLTHQRIGPAHAFWVIKHGVKASGMPAWGHSMADEYVWNLAAFLQRLPTLDTAAYREMVARSGGHSHGGGEGHHHDGAADGDADHHDDDGPHPHQDGHHGDDAAGEGAAPSTATAAPAGASASAGRVHVHADGKRHVHPAAPR